MVTADEKILSLHHNLETGRSLDSVMLLSILSDLNKEIQELKTILQDHIANKKMHEC